MSGRTMADGKDDEVTEVTDLMLRKTRLKTAFTKTKSKILYLVNFEETLDKKQCKFQQNKYRRFLRTSPLSRYYILYPKYACISKI